MIELWTPYKRAEIPSWFGAEFNPANWNAGVVNVEPYGLVLLATITGGIYANQFQSETTFKWYSQTSTAMASKRGQMLLDDFVSKHLFVRSNKRASFIYCGDVTAITVAAEKPMIILWELPEAVPEAFKEGFGL